MKIKIKAVGGAQARRFPAGLPMWVLAAGHWTVNARELVPGSNCRSSVNFVSRIINFDSEDLTPHRVGNSAGAINAECEF